MFRFKDFVGELANSLWNLVAEPWGFHNPYVDYCQDCWLQLAGWQWGLSTLFFTVFPCLLALTYPSGGVKI